jgi:hypothetical protein
MSLNRHSCEATARRKAEAEVSEANMRARDAERAKFDAENAQLAAEALRDRCVWPTLRHCASKSP